MRKKNVLTPELIKQWDPINDNKYDINDLKTTDKPVWVCDLGHTWETTVSKRLYDGTGCPFCGNQKVWSGFNDLQTINPTLANEWHPTLNLNIKPDQVTFGSRKKIWWVCAKNHEWIAEVNHRVNGTGCPTCSSQQKISKGEKELQDFILSLNLSETIFNTRKILDGKELDIYIPSKNIGIEYNGVYWHSEAFSKDKNSHYDKWLESKNKGIQLIQIWEDDWLKNSEKIKRMLSHKLGVSVQPKIYARKTLVETITKKETEIFLNNNHIQGLASGSYYLGLKTKNTETLVAVLVVKKETNGKTLNIIRYATNHNVIGGFTKLLSHVEKTYNPEKFITFSDNCVSDGGLYENNDFVADKYLPPDYMYVVRGIRKHKFGYRLKNFKNNPNLQYVEGLTESKLAELNGLNRIWDAGKTRWVKINK